MAPVVDGLEEKYQDQVEFKRIDAGSQSGNSAFQFYALRGHPGYILLNSDGTILWSGVGEQPAAKLEEQILGAQFSGG